MLHPCCNSKFQPLRHDSVFGIGDLENESQKIAIRYIGDWFELSDVALNHLPRWETIFFQFLFLFSGDRRTEREKKNALHGDVTLCSACDHLRMR